MTRETTLERRYRRLLAWYPRAFRRDHGQELLAVLLAGARDGQRRPGPAATADLVKSGLWLRLRPSVPREAPTVRAAVRLMHLGAAVTALSLAVSVLALAHVGPAGATLRLFGHRQPFPVAVAFGIGGGFAAVAAWLWMAWAAGHKKRWGRAVATVLCALAALELLSACTGAQRALGLVVWVPTFLVGLGAVLLLWRPGSSEYFSPPDRAGLERHAGAASRARSFGPTVGRRATTLTRRRLGAS